MSRDLNDGERIRSRFQGGLVRLFFLCLAILHSQQGLTRWLATKWPTVLVHYIVIKLFRGGIPSGTLKSHSAEVNPISWLIRTPA